jgi:hypothetical protein
LALSGPIAFRDKQGRSYRKSNDNVFSDIYNLYTVELPSRTKDPDRCWPEGSVELADGREMFIVFSQFPDLGKGRPVGIVAFQNS